jgi:peptide deformylase
MDSLELISFADARLKKKPTPFNFETDNASDLREKLLISMHKLGGIGLSANQVGLDMAVFVIGKVGTADSEKAIFNPRLLNVSDEKITMREGCLSFPNLWISIKRPRGAILEYQDETGKTVVEEFKGVSARVVLHEFDHMLGQNFTMRASKLKIARALKGIDKKVKTITRRKTNV